MRRRFRGSAELARRQLGLRDSARCLQRCDDFVGRRTVAAGARCSGDLDRCHAVLRHLDVEAVRELVGEHRLEIDVADQRHVEHLLDRAHAAAEKIVDQQHI